MTSTTSVKVALRVRPLTAKETLANCSECISFIPNQPQIILGSDRSFTFDYVFAPDVSQAWIYQECVSPLISKFIEGYNATVLAYGQTGSGKTYSMGTGLDSQFDLDSQGMVPRAIYALFEQLPKTYPPPNSYQVTVSFLELYNEELIDLLNITRATSSASTFSTQTTMFSSTSSSTSTSSSSTTPTLDMYSRPGSASSTKSDPLLRIREDEFGNIVWVGVREEICQTPDQLLGILSKGSLCRTTGSTDMNMSSSRSHAIFSINLRIHKIHSNELEQPPETIQCKFHFVDLAGSERLKKTHAEGTRAREGISINSGLLALGNVISALGDDNRQEQRSHIPYRDSKLTRLLQDSLGGNSQTLMLACVSPADSNFQETLNTLKYANRARNIKNKVMINQHIATNTLEVHQLRTQITRLKLELSALKEASGVPLRRASSSMENLDRSKLSDLQKENAKLEFQVQRLEERIGELERQLILLQSERDLMLVQLHKLPLPSLSLSSSSSSSSSSSPMVQDIETEPKVNLDPELQKKRRDEEIPTSLELQDLKNTVPSSSLLSNTMEPHPLMKEYLTKIHALKKQVYTQETELLFLKNHFQLISQWIHPSSIEPPLPSSSSSSTSSTSTSSSSSLSSSKRSYSARESRTFPSMFTSSAWTSSSSSSEPSALLTTSFPYSGIKPSHSIVLPPVASLIEKTKHQLQQEIQFLLSTSTFPFSKDFASLVASETTTFLLPPPPSSSSNEESMDLDMAAPSLSSLRPKESNLDPTQVPLPLSSYSSTMTISPSSQTNAPHFIPSSTSPAAPPSSSSSSSLFLLEQSLQKLHSNIAIKEELIQSLNRTYQEYTLMRQTYDDKFQQLQANMNTVKMERDEAVTRLQSAHHKQKETEVRLKYESKVKQLLNEISQLRRTQVDTTKLMTSSKKSDMMIRQLKASMEKLKVEKQQLFKKMKESTEKSKEQVTMYERELQKWKRKEKLAMEMAKKFERNFELQKLLLKKRTEEVMASHQKLKNVTTLLNRSNAQKLGNSSSSASSTSTPTTIINTNVNNGSSKSSFSSSTSTPSASILSAPMSPRTFTKPFSAPATGSPSTLTQVMTPDLDSSSMSSSAAPGYSFSEATLAFRKQQLYKELEAVVHAQKVNQQMDELLSRRHQLNDEKSMLQKEKEHVLALPTSVNQPDATLYLDEPMALIEAELQYLDTRIKEVQNETVQLDPPEQHYEFICQWVRSFHLQEALSILQSLIDEMIQLQILTRTQAIEVKNLQELTAHLRRTMFRMRNAAIGNTLDYENKIKSMVTNPFLLQHHSQNLAHIDRVVDMEVNASLDRTSSKLVSPSASIRSSHDDVMVASSDPTSRSPTTSTLPRSDTKPTYASSSLSSASSASASASSSSSSSSGPSSRRNRSSMITGQDVFERLAKTYTVAAQAKVRDPHREENDPNSNPTVLNYPTPLPPSTIPSNPTTSSSSSNPLPPNSSSPNPQDVPFTSWTTSSFHSTSLAPSPDLSNLPTIASSSSAPFVSSSSFPKPANYSSPLNPSTNTANDTAMLVDPE